MKKYIVLLVLILLVSVMVLPAHAAAQVSLKASKTAPNPGDEVTVSVNVKDAGSHKKGGITVDYDINALELISGEWVISGTDLATFSTSLKDGVFGCSAAKTISGDILKLKFKVRSAAALGATTVSVSLSLSDYTFSASTSVTVTCKHTYSSWSKVDNTNHTRKCSTCGVVETVAHNFDHGCDETCNSCSFTRETTHEYGTDWSGDAKFHFHACIHCGDRKDAELHTPGPEATEESAQICTFCQLVIVEKLEHVHVFDGAQTDETNHWYICTKCGETVDFGEHVYLYDCDALCDVCGYARPTDVPHTPSTEWASDENSHWYPCLVCQEKVDEAAHTGDVNVKEPQCDICAHVLPHEHLYAETWSSNVMEHWHECVCGDRVDITDHTWSEGVVTEEPYRDKQGTMTYTCTVCGEEDTAIMIETIRDLLPWWIACGVLGVLVLGMAVTLVVIIVKANKKSTGKYAMK